MFTNGQNVNNMAEIAQLNAKLANIDAEIGTIMVEFFTVKNNIQDARQKTGTAYGQALLIENNINRPPFPFLNIFPIIKHPKHPAIICIVRPPCLNAMQR